MFDSFYTKCPKCKRQLEIQSKTGPCMLMSFYKSDLPAIVAVGLNGDVIMCEFCKINWKVECNLPKVVKVKLIKTKDKKTYSGNYNENLPENIERAKELAELMKK